MQVEEIRALIEVFEHTSLTEMELQRGEWRLILKRDSNKATAPPVAVTPLSPPVQTSPPVALSQTTGAAKSASPMSDKKSPTAGYVIEAPIVGTFFRRPAPEEEPYIEIGDRVNPGDTVCLVEAMKVMNEVRTERAGIVKEILVQDGKPVEYGQPLIVLDLFEG